MAGANLDIRINCGRDFYISLTNQTAAGHPWDMRGYAAVMTVKAHIDDSDANALFQSVPYWSDLAFGKLSFKLPHETTGNWWLASPSGSGAVSTACVYDISYADNAIPTKNWSTMLSGAVNLEQPVTIVIPGG
jgi:hypothetical protein